MSEETVLSVIKRRRLYIEASINRYLSALETADRQDKADFNEAKSQHLQEKIALLKEQMAKLESIEAQLKESPDKQISLTDPDARATRGRESSVIMSKRRLIPKIT